MDKGQQRKGSDEYRILVNMLDRVAAERARQRRLHAEGRITDDCANPQTDEDAVLRVLIEEVGEVARGADQLVKLLRRYPNTAGLSGRIRTRLQLLQKEYIQVAAVAVARAEGLEQRIAA